jgi:hypothetical protein
MSVSREEHRAPMSVSRDQKREEKREEKKAQSVT